MAWLSAPFARILCGVRLRLHLPPLSIVDIFPVVILKPSHVVPHICPSVLRFILSAVFEITYFFDFFVDYIRWNPRILKCLSKPSQNNFFLCLLRFHLISLFQMQKWFINIRRNKFQHIFRKLPKFAIQLWESFSTPMNWVKPLTPSSHGNVLHYSIRNRLFPPPQRNE